MDRLAALSFSVLVSAAIASGCTDDSVTPGTDGGSTGSDARAADADEGSDAYVGPSEWPGPSNTGVPPGVTLTPYEDSCTITADGTVIDGRSLNCDVVILA